MFASLGIHPLMRPRIAVHPLMRPRIAIQKMHPRTQSTFLTTELDFLITEFCGACSVIHSFLTRVSSAQAEPLN